MSIPSISIVVAVYNGAGTLQRCIDSVITQTYPDRELIIMDGGSNDGTVEILKSNDEQIAYWESEPDRGIHHAWNKALKQTKGDWICFLGSDDYFADKKVLEMVGRYASIADSKKIKVIYGQVSLVTEEERFIELRGKPWEKTKKSFRMKKMAIPHQGCFFHWNMFSVHGNFDESFTICADYEMLLRELKTEDALFMPDTVVTVMAAGGLSNSPALQVTILNEEIRARKMHGLYRFDAWLTIQFLALMLAKSVSLIVGDKYGRLLLDGYRFCVGKSSRWSM